MRVVRVPSFVVKDKDLEMALLPRISLICWAGLLMIGCSKPVASVAQIGKHVLTGEELAQGVQYQLYMDDLRSKKRNKTDKYYQDVTNRVIAAFKLNALISDDAAAKHIGVPRATLFADLTNQYVRGFMRKTGNFTSLTQKIAKAGLYVPFKRDFDARLLRENYFSTAYSNQVICSRAEAGAQRQRLLSFNIRMDETNRYAAVRATNVWRLAQQPGADFSLLVKRYTEEPDGGKNASGVEMDVSDFSDSPESWEIVSRLVPHHVSQIIANDYGYFIYYLNNTPERESDGRFFSGNLSRIWIRKALKYDVPTVDQLQKIIRADRLRNVQKVAISNLMEHAGMLQTPK